MPGNGPSTGENLGFFFGKGDVLTIGLDRYIYRKEAVNQPWLDEVLGMYPKPFIFAMGHEPAFMDGSHKDTMDANHEQSDAFWGSMITCISQWSFSLFAVRNSGSNRWNWLESLLQFAGISVQKLRSRRNVVRS